MHITNKDQNVLITPVFYWEKIDHSKPEKMPYGLKCLLIRKEAGVSYEGILTSKEKFADHYAPYPKFRK